MALFDREETFTCRSCQGMIFQEIKAVTYKKEKNAKQAVITKHTQDWIVCIKCGEKHLLSTLEFFKDTIISKS